MPFNIGPGELIVILAIGLLVFGPKKLPELGGSIGEAINNFKKSLQTHKGSSKEDVTTENLSEKESKV